MKDFEFLEIFDFSQIIFSLTFDPKNEAVRVTIRKKSITVS
jgi:hypothetical protein